MTFGEKLKKLRIEAGLSQVQLAEKLCVSRQAITKWENNRGIPDIDNLQGISHLFGKSIDSLMDNGSEVNMNVIREEIDINSYDKKNFRSRYDAVAKEKYSAASVIYPLVRRKKLSMAEAIVDFIVQPGVVNVADSFDDRAAYYLVELMDKQLLLQITKTSIEAQELVRPFLGKKCVIGKNKFIKATYKL